MKNWKKLLALVVVGMLMVLGGCSMSRSKQTVSKKEQDRVVQYIIDHIELVDGDSIKKVKFTKIKYEEMPGSWWITVEINGQYKLSLSEGKLGGEIRTSRFSSKEIRQVDSTELVSQESKVDVLYYE
ncbi:hypothetical protein [Streptococcus suis]|uniref:hypothetical protein n=1 Tax=Streptococcus suis TaxID=1307 RepID=UPI0015532769|nr:hypothetical protein [Streptococcus suis]NQH33490.1 hypothetical protein [Streptococcus suis]NQO46990.1 hypothetical protein [Streptococcus suis]WNF84404.1 hypothetical protein RJW52_00310 [Streptococcus suis]